MKLSTLFDNATKEVSDNLPAVLSVVACIGVVTTVIFTVKGTSKAVKSLEEEEKELSNKEIIKKVAPYYFPMVLTGSLTMACIIEAQRINADDKTALMAALATSSQALFVTKQDFNQYRRIAKETFGENAEKEIRKKVAEEKMKETSSNLLSQNEHGVIQTGHGNQLFYDKLARGYFRSDPYHMKECMMELKDMLRAYDWVNINDYYRVNDLPTIEICIGDNIGWNTCNMYSYSDFDIDFSETMQSPWNEPAIVINFSLEPRYEYEKNH